MKKKTVIIIFSAVAVALCLALAGVAAGRYVTDRRLPAFTGKYVLYVYPDTDVDTVIDSLVSGAGAVRRGSLERCARSEGLKERMMPGRYVIEPSFPAVYAVRMLCNGWQTPQNLTLSGTLRSRERIAKAIGTQMMVDSASIYNALNDTSFLAVYGFTPENVFAMILPDTYEMYWTASVKDIFDRFSREYDVFWTEERKAAAADLGLSPMEVSIVASIVNGETLCAEEYSCIAGVYLNRLRKGMKLQADPTIAYCFGYTLNRILKVHLKVDSPYNTYKHYGLPPAPINVPPKACIDAVLSSDEHGYLFFCASPDFNGRHRFAVKYSDHLKNAREFQRALTLRLREKEKAGAS